MARRTSARQYPERGDDEHGVGRPPKNDLGNEQCVEAIGCVQEPKNAGDNEELCGPHQCYEVESTLPFGYECGNILFSQHCEDNPRNRTANRDASDKDGPVGDMPQYP